jgi:sulfur-carrier protein
MPTVWIPGLLQDLTGGQQIIRIPGNNILQVIDHLEALYPGIKSRLCEGETLRPSIAVAVDGEVSPQKLRHPLQEDSEVHFLPAISGGQGEA